LFHSSSASRAIVGRFRSRLLLEIDVGERLPISIKDDKATADPVRGRGSSTGPEAAGSGGAVWAAALHEPWLIVPSVFPMGWVLVLNLSEPLSSSSFSSSELR
jgi:hypothetical protein